MRVSHLQDREIMAMLDGCDSKSGKARTAALKHLKECEECARQASQMVELYDLLGAMPTARLSEDFTGKVMKKVRRLESSRWERWEVALSSLVPATVAAVVFPLLDLREFVLNFIVWWIDVWVRADVLIHSLAWPDLSLSEVDLFRDILRPVHESLTPILEFLSRNSQLSAMLSAMALILLLVSVADLPVPHFSRRRSR